MKSPEKLQPAGIGIANGGSNADAPTLDVTEATKTSVASVADAPKLTPPERATAGITAASTGVWSADKRVNGLYTTFNARNSWMSIIGIGWKKLATNSDSANEAMSLLAAHCREKNCRIDFSEDNGEVKEIYVW